MKHILLLAAFALLTSCSSPFNGEEQFDIGLARGMERQADAASQISAAYAGARVPRPMLQPLAPLQPLQ
jgi:hypothetical protein